VILIDGLGSNNLKASGAHAGYLNSRTSMPASCYFPATTATSIVSFATGKPPWETNFIGYQIYERHSDTKRNLLTGWESPEVARDFQGLPTVSEMAIDRGVEFHTVAPNAYKESGFTAATMRGSAFHGTKTLAERFEIAKTLLADPKPKVIYLYVPELDQLAHAKGWQSQDWLSKLEDLDAEVSALANGLSKTSAIVVTADHGVIDVPRSNHVYIDSYIEKESLLNVAGDTRALYLYLRDASSRDSYLEILQKEIGDSCYLVTPEDLIDASYWSKEIERDLVPDILILAKKEVALYHRDFAKKKSLEMIGHHGSITGQEMSIPLIAIGY
jgi:predicted AlkP superfamily pyrophosphatase or phosphodiesterase